MWQLATAYIEIAFGRRGPESLPNSTFLLLALLAVHFPLGIVVRALLGDFSAGMLAVFLLDTSLYLAFVFAVLRFFKFEQRYRQTMSALLGIEVLFNLVFIPLGIFALGSNLSFSEPPLFVVYLVILFWWFGIAAFILGRALTQPMIVGLMFVLLYFLTQLSISDLLQPAAAPDPAEPGAAMQVVAY